MKKLFVLFIFLILASCAWNPVVKDTPTDPAAQYQMSPEALDKLMSLLEETGANKIRAFTGRTGGTSGKLDSIAVASLTDDDLGLVFDVSNNTMYFYIFVAAATDTETDPYYIRPDDYSSSGVWYLMTSMAFHRSAEPTWNFRDSGCTAFDANAKIYVNCTDEGDGTEDCDFKIAVQIAGNMTDIITIDADGYVTLAALDLHTVKEITGGLYTVNITGGNCTFGTDCDSTSVRALYGGVIYVSSQGATITLPAVADGMSFSIITIGALAVALNPNDNDLIYLDGTALSDGDSVTNTSTTGDILVCSYYSADGYVCLSGSNDGDPWTDTN